MTPRFATGAHRSAGAFRLGPVAALVSALTLGACSGAVTDAGMPLVKTRIAADAGADAVKLQSSAEADAARARVASLLAAPLTADAAAQVALLGHPGLQADYNALGQAEDAFDDAPAPVFPSLAEWVALAAHFDAAAGRKTFAALAAGIRQRAAAEAGLKAATFAAVEATLRTAAEARRAYYRAVAARQKLALVERAQSTVEIAAELSRKQGETGAATKLFQARAALFHAQSLATLARARLEAESAREGLVRALGVGDDGAGLDLPADLPDLPVTLPPADAETKAAAGRADVMAARYRRDALAWAPGDTEAAGDPADADRDAPAAAGARADGAGHTAESGKDTPTDGGAGERPEAYNASVNRLAEVSDRARSEAREAYLRYRTAYDVARIHRESIVPLGRTIDEQTLLEYNGMLVDVFELLAASRQGIEGNIAAIDARRDFFIAEVDLRAAIAGGGGGSGGEPAADASASPSAPGGH